MRPLSCAVGEVFVTPLVASVLLGLVAVTGCVVEVLVVVIAGVGVCTDGDVAGIGGNPTVPVVPVILVRSELLA